MYMDASSLKSKASGRRSSSEGVNSGWKCNYCNKTFSREKSFLTHECNGKKRFEQMKTPIGQAAYASYNQWMKSKRHSEQSVNTFTTSRYYATFIRFSEYCIKLSIDANSFIKFIAQKHNDLLPTLWMNSSVYALYLKHYDDLNDPWDQVIESQNFVEKKAEILECEPDLTFQVMGFRQVLEAVRLKKISPWFLFTSKIGLKFLHSLEKDDYKIIEGVINYEAWSQRFHDNEKLVLELQAILNP
jgi:hypothetical protein